MIRLFIMLLTLVYILEVALALLLVVLTARTILLSSTHSSQSSKNHHDSGQAEQCRLETSSEIKSSRQQSIPPKNEVTSADSAQDTLTDYISETLSGSNESKNTVNEPPQYRNAQASPTSPAPQTAASQNFIDQMLLV